MKKLLSAIFVLIAAALCACAVYADDPVEISSPEDLRNIAQNPSGSYVLTCDIDMAGTDWKPIAFSGKLDGQGHRILNLTISTLGDEVRTTLDCNSKEYESRFAGLFSVVEDAEISNLGLYRISCDITSEESSFVGMVGGYVHGSVIKNCKVYGYGSLTTTGHNMGIGGIAGYGGNSTVDGCDADVCLVNIDKDKEYKDEEFMGGILAVGYMHVTNNNVNISGFISEHGYVHSGGLIGSFWPYETKEGTWHIDYNTVNGGIKFFEDNSSRRAYCKGDIGEIMRWIITRDHNSTGGFKKDEVKKYDTDLLPDDDDKRLTDRELKDKTEWDGTSYSITAEEPIYGIYLVFKDYPGEHSVWVGDTKVLDGKDFQQEYLDLSDLEEKPLAVTVKFEAKPTVNEHHSFTGSAGFPVLPDFVHVWQDPLEKCDILLLSGHADDEQLFFAGLFPYYSMVRGMDVQVAYMTDHSVSSGRQLERLNGLWACGVRNYPLTTKYPDYYSESYSEAISKLKTKGITEESFIEWERETIKATNPQVIITHDVNGEYSHGLHMAVARTLQQALSDGFAESQTSLKRVFLHLYDENTMSFSVIDEAFDELGGLTPFQWTQKYGYPAHKSQQYTWFTGWINGKDTKITKASQIKKYSPLSFGMFYGTSSLSTEATDFFEGLTSYKEQEAEAKRLEEEARRKEEERLAKEREEEERLAREKEEAERLAAEKRANTLKICAAAAVVIAAAAVLIKKKSKPRYRGKH